MGEAAGEVGDLLGALEVPVLVLAVHRDLPVVKRQHEAVSALLHDAVAMAQIAGLERPERLKVTRDLVVLVREDDVVLRSVLPPEGSAADMAATTDH